MDKTFNIMKDIDIEQFLSIDDYATDKRKSRRKTGKNTQEFFTPYSIVKTMADKIDESYWHDATKTFLEPCFGNGQFVIYIIYRRLMSGIDWRTTLETLYGVELMQDNVNETYSRVIKLLDEMQIEYDKMIAYEIMRKNLVCCDFFEWDFENWCPKHQNQPKQLELQFE